MINNEVTNSNLLQIIFDMKNEMSSYKKETDKKIADLEKTIKIQNQIIKQKDNEISELKQTIVELKEEHAKATAILINEINELKEENKQLKQKLKEKDKEINKLNKKITTLEKKNQKLENSLSRNSSNSSKPSSTDGFHKIVHSLRKKSDKPVGGQINHDGSTLTKKNITNIIQTNKGNVTVKKETLYVNNKKLDGTKKYKIDTQMSVIITEYNLVYKEDADCLPKELKNTVTYGENLKSLVVLLNEEHAVPVQRTVDIIREITYNVINLSTGTVINISYELKDKLKLFTENVKKYILRKELAHKDETMMPCNGEHSWFHVFSTKEATYYYYHDTRGNQADIEKGLLRIFTGTLEHDHLKGLYRFQCDHAECNAHILRYLTFVIERYNRQWAKDLKELLLKIKEEIKSEMEKGNNCLRAESILKYEKEYSEILKAGKEEFNKDTNPYKDYNGEDMKLLRRLIEFKENHLAFMYDFRIPFDNNLAERDLRMIKAKKKISGCFRSNKGGETYATIKSYLSTMRKQKNNLFQSIKSAFEREPFLLNA